MDLHIYPTTQNTLVVLLILGCSAPSEVRDDLADIEPTSEDTHQARIDASSLPRDPAAEAAVDAFFDGSVDIEGRRGIEPEGYLGIRADDGSWQDVRFDAADGGPCEGCGVVYDAEVPTATVRFEPEAWSST